MKTTKPSLVVVLCVGNNCAPTLSKLLKHTSRTTQLQTDQLRKEGHDTSRTTVTVVTILAVFLVIFIATIIFGCVVRKKLQADKKNNFFRGGLSLPRGTERENNLSHGNIGKSNNKSVSKAYRNNDLPLRDASKEPTNSSQLPYSDGTTVSGEKDFFDRTDRMDRFDALLLPSLGQFPDETAVEENKFIPPLPARPKVGSRNPLQVFNSSKKFKFNVFGRNKPRYRIFSTQTDKTANSQFSDVMGKSKKKILKKKKKHIFEISTEKSSNKPTAESSTSSTNNLANQILKPSEKHTVKQSTEVVTLRVKKPRKPFIGMNSTEITV